MTDDGDANGGGEDGNKLAPDEFLAALNEFGERPDRERTRQALAASTDLATVLGALFDPPKVIPGHWGHYIRCLPEYSPLFLALLHIVASSDRTFTIEVGPFDPALSSSIDDQQVSLKIRERPDL